MVREVTKNPMVTLTEFICGDGRTFQQDNLLPEGGGSIMLWGGFSVARTGRRKMNRAKYREILDENLFQSIQDLRLG